MGALLFGSTVSAAETLHVRLTWGETNAPRESYSVHLQPQSPSLRVTSFTAVQVEPDDRCSAEACQGSAGNGDVDGAAFTLTSSAAPVDSASRMHIIWADLIAQSDAGTARRLSQDASLYPDSPRLTVSLNPEGTRGFTVSFDQLRRERALWIPSLHVFIATGEQPVTLAEHLKQIAPFQGQRILDQIATSPEATYDEYRSRWEDMGDPAYVNPETRGPGHIVCLTWDSAMTKFGIDRGAGVHNDYGNPDHFQFWYGFGDLTHGVSRTWKGQRLQDGLPVITTTFEQDGARYEVEQFAYPLNGPPAERRGDIPMVLLQRVTVTDLTGKARRLPVALYHRRQLPSFIDSTIVQQNSGDTVLFTDKAYRRTLLAVGGPLQSVSSAPVEDYQREMKRINVTATLDLPARGSQSFVVKLSSPLVAADDQRTFTAIDYDKAKQQTLDFWTQYVSRGARFEVPEKAVNDLYRASLWHALRLPRRHGGSGAEVTIDLPYSNFAYSQTGTPWPVNQAVYVDYMLYNLRGYHGISTEELKAQFRNNQETNGHVNGYANWGVYTPSMLYAVAQNYLLSGDRQALDQLLPQSVKAMEYCLEELKRAQATSGDAAGLFSAPLNDITGEGIWAFNQAYLYAGLQLFGQVLKQIGNPHADAALQAAGQLQQAAQSSFLRASVRSPLVQLRDQTWQPYVPCNATVPRRMMEHWYPTDVDTGAVHMLRLKLLPAKGELADWLLNDHEDNLFLKGWGIANEPVYNQHATAYLLRDQAKAAIRTFYSYMNSAFSHSVDEPVEHRWTHGQYFGPPSTDGAWFELYRNMLVHEDDENQLILGLAAPRTWLRSGKEIHVEKAPTYFGDLSYHVKSFAASGTIEVAVTVPQRQRPSALVVRLRHPSEKKLRAVSINGRPWTEFDPAQEWIRIPSPAENQYSIVAQY